jgi:hypothetical protein
MIYNVSAPGGGGGPPLWYDEKAGRLLIGDFWNRSLRIIDPTSGGIVRAVSLPDNLTALMGDDAVGEIFVSTYSRSHGTGSTLVLDESTLNPLATTHVWSSRPPDIDRVHGDAYFSLGPSVQIVNLSTHDVVDSPLVVPVESWVAYDGSTDTFAAAGRGGGADLVLISVSRALSANPPLSALPLFGASLPGWLGVTGFLGGGVILVARGILGNRDNGPPATRLSTGGGFERSLPGTDRPDDREVTGPAATKDSDGIAGRSS